MKYLIPLLLLTSCSAQRYIEQALYKFHYSEEEIIVVDSTVWHENIDNPGTFSPNYDTIIVSKYKCNLITGKQIIKYKIKH